MNNKKQPIFKPKLITSLKGYTGAQFGKDLTAGLIVAIIALPLSIALALASGVTPEQGLYTAIVAGFVISIVGLLLSCFGITFGVLILALEIYFAIMGLKTSKKGFSIATFVLSGLSFLVLIAQIVLVVLFG